MIHALCHGPLTDAGSEPQSSWAARPRSQPINSRARIRTLTEGSWCQHSRWPFPGLLTPTVIPFPGRSAGPGRKFGADSCLPVRDCLLLRSGVHAGSAALQLGQGFVGSLGSCRAGVSSLYLPSSCRLTGEGGEPPSPGPRAERCPDSLNKKGFLREA